jgi:hypothetical protein
LLSELRGPPFRGPDPAHEREVDAHAAVDIQLTFRMRLMLSPFRLQGATSSYAPVAPMIDVEGDIDALPMWAGHGVGLVKNMQPAADIVREIDAEASVLTSLGRSEEN